MFARGQAEIEGPAPAGLPAQWEETGEGIFMVGEKACEVGPATESLAGRSLPWKVPSWGQSWGSGQTCTRG